MANHPNRSPGNPAANPNPQQIRDLRESHKLTQTEAAALVFTTQRNWAMWEAGDSRMHPAFWQLFSLKCQMQRKT